MTTTVPATTTPWTPKPAALRDLVLLMLHKQGAIIDGTGRVASRIREYFTLPDTKTINTQLSEVLGLMEQTKLIKRSMNESRTRTYGIELLQELTTTEATTLEEAHKANLALFIGNTDNCEVNLAELGRQCQLAYRELQGAASRALRRDTSGRVAINVKGVLKAIGISGETERRLRYYLKELGLICSHNQCDDTSAQLWWWTISTDPLDAAKLRSLASGERSFEASQERRKRERSGTPKAGPVTVRKVDTDAAAETPAPEGTGVVEVSTPATRAARPGPRPRQQVAAQPETVQVVDDPIEALLGIVTRLETQLTDEREAHGKELAAKDEEIAELQQKLAARQATDPRVAAVIARFSDE